jgi:hypothetical protein
MSGESNGAPSSNATKINGFFGLSVRITSRIGGSFSVVVVGSVRMITSTTLPNPSSSSTVGRVRR